MLKTDLIAPVCALLRRQASERPTRMAFRDAHSSLDYATLERSTALLASQLQAAGLAEGESVALMLPNSVAWVQGCLATLRAGGVFVPISNDSAPPEVAYRLADADATLLVISVDKAQQLAAVIEAAPRLRTLVLVGAGTALSTAAPSTAAPSADVLSGLPGHSAAGALQRLSFEALLQDASAAATLPSARDPLDTQGVSFIVYTSGTTGQPKGVQLSQHGMMWAVAACWEPVFQLSAADHLLSPLPLFHSYALNLCVLTPIALGMGVTILERYSTQEVRERLRTGEYTLMPGVPTMFNYLLEAEKGQPPSRLPGMRLFYTAGAIMPAPLSQAFERQFGVPLLDGYGITETSTMVTSNWPQATRIPGSCGMPLGGLAVRLVDLEDKDVPFGEEGELIVRGPTLMLGYRNKPQESERALRGGWYRTGDLARADANGYLTITGRLKELIIRGGQNIAPAEVEVAVNGFPGVVDCAVVGAPHDKLGEVPVVFVVSRPGEHIDQEALLAHCRSQLSAYKVPAAVHAIDSIPRTGSGKTMRFRLTALLKS